MSLMGAASASFRFIGGRPRTSSMVRMKLRVVYGCGDDRILHVSSGHVCRGAVRIHVVAAILRVVFHNEDQRVVLVDRAVGNLLYQQANGVVVVGHVALWRVHLIDCRAEVSGVVVHEANQGQIRQPAVGVVGIEVPLPLLEAVKSGKEGSKPRKY